MLPNTAAFVQYIAPANAPNSNAAYSYAERSNRIVKPIGRGESFFFRRPEAV
jgi:hypothetical protein